MKKLNIQPTLKLWEQWSFRLYLGLNIKFFHTFLWPDNPCMIIKFDYNNFLIMDGENLLSISHHLFPVFTCKNRIMLSVWAGRPALLATCMAWVIVCFGCYCISNGEDVDQRVSSSIAWTLDGRSPHIPLRDNPRPWLPEMSLPHDVPHCTLYANFSMVRSYRGCLCSLSGTSD